MIHTMHNLGDEHMLEVDVPDGFCPWCHTAAHHCEFDAPNQVAYLCRGPGETELREVYCYGVMLAPEGCGCLVPLIRCKPVTPARARQVIGANAKN